jgi:hypothetical protein
MVLGVGVAVRPASRSGGYVRGGAWGLFCFFDENGAWALMGYGLGTEAGRVSWAWGPFIFSDRSFDGVAGFSVRLLNVKYEYL